MRKGVGIQALETHCPAGLTEEERQVYQSVFKIALEAKPLEEDSWGRHEDRESLAAAAGRQAVIHRRHEHSRLR